MTNLLINVDHVATLRNARREAFPDPVHAAALCEMGGADGIVFHLRRDRRHITERDVELLKNTVNGKLDFELSTDEEIVDICRSIEPDLATLVPESREEVTTEGGLDVLEHKDRLSDVIADLQERDVQVSLFVDPIDEQIETAARLEADCIELHTGEYANAESEKARHRTLSALSEGARTAYNLGLRVHAGHGLDYRNYPAFRENVPHVQEVSIGFAVVARSVMSGMEEAVREMRRVVKGY